MAGHHREFSSFRDPAGNLFWDDGVIYRQINHSYAAQFQACKDAGLFAEGMNDGWLLPFTEVKDGSDGQPIVIRPSMVPFISYPYEWCFDQLKDAAIATLDIHLRALKHGLLLKDATAFNIQFVEGRPQLIDHLSFDFISEYPAWPAYGQFCRHFLAPLALMSHVDLSLGKLSQSFLDGVPLPLASSLLPLRTRWKPSLYLHIHMHAKMQVRHAGTGKRIATRQMPATHPSAFATSLRGLVESLSPKKQATEWGKYYEATNYSGESFKAKKAIVDNMIARASPSRIWDVGGNNGEFSRAVAGQAGDIVCMDIDPVAVSLNYQICKKLNLKSILPLVVDLTNPTPAVGFANKERSTLEKRGKPDLVMALALVHHLAISNNVPFDYIARYFASITEWLLIEFVGKSDSQIERLLRNRKDIFPDYHLSAFKESFEGFFTCEMEQAIPATERVMFLFKNAADPKGVECP